MPLASNISRCTSLACSFMYCKYFKKQREQMFNFICIGNFPGSKEHIFEMEQVYKGVKQSIFLFASLSSVCGEDVF